MNDRVVYAKEKSESAKLGEVSATYVSQRTCPSACPFMGAGCYAENGPIYMVATSRLNHATPVDMTPERIAAIEAVAIGTLTGKRDLRLHVVGDSPTIRGTVQLAHAAAGFIAKAGRKVWTYTHAWRDVPRDAWGDVSALASCETPDQVREAKAQGYVAALTATGFPIDTKHTLDGITVLPCPEQSRGVKCVDCRLCFDDAKLRRLGIDAIGFAVHGSVGSKSMAANTLANLTGMIEIWPARERKRAATYKQPITRDRVGTK